MQEDLARRTFTVSRPDGEMEVVHLKPSNPSSDMLIVIFMEAFGVVPSICEVGDMLIEEGFEVIIPDLFYPLAKPNVASYDDIPKAMELMGQLVSRGKAFVDDVNAVLDQEFPERPVGLIGFCMGGALSFAYACDQPTRCQSLASFYGGGIVNLLGGAGAIRGRVELFFGGKDELIPTNQIEEIDVALSQHGLEYAITVYPEADHGFFNRQRQGVYDSKASEDAWSKVVALFKTQSDR